MREGVLLHINRRTILEDSNIFFEEDLLRSFSMLKYVKRIEYLIVIDSIIDTINLVLHVTQLVRHYIIAAALHNGNRLFSDTLVRAHSPMLQYKYPL